MQSELTCPLCNKQYKDDNLPRLLLMTGLTYCENCINGLISTQLNQQEGTKRIILTCPQDSSVIELKSADINNFPKNIALIKVIEAKKASLSFRDQEQSINVSKIAKQEEIQEDDDANELITAMKEKDQPTSQLHEKPQQSKNTLCLQKIPEFCLLHQKPLQIVCMLDLMRICANCAIFGQHKGHQFRSLEQIQKQSTNYSNDILMVMENKQNIKNKMENKQTYDGIMDVLDKKKDKIHKQILEHYIKLKKTIQINQKNSLGCLDDLFQKISIKFQNLMKFDAKILKKYQKWEIESLQQIKKLQGNAFQQKLQLLFPKRKTKDDIRNKGNQIVSEMELQLDNLFSEVQTVLDNIGLSHSNSVYKSLEDFIVLQEDLKKNSSITGYSRHPQEQNSKNHKYYDEYEQKRGSSPLEQSLLQIEDDQMVDMEVVKPQFSKTEDYNLLKVEESINIQKLDLKFADSLRVGSEDKKNTNALKSTLPTENITQRPNKKKLAKLKLSEKTDKIVRGILADSLQNVDFTNAELGDANLALISEFIKGTKVRTIKLIRNKLTDDGIRKIIPYLGNVITLNLSQNNLTEQVIDVFIDNISLMPSLKSLILSQNKIDQRKHKIRIDKLRKLQITVSV